MVNINNLKELRLQRKISIKDMAKSTGMSRGLVSLIESGKANTSFDNIQNYVNRLGDVEMVLIVKC